MKTTSLEAHGAHPSLLAAWTRQYGQELLPIQERAVIQGGVLRGESIVGSGPTGCGKTFIGEMAGTHAASQGRRAIYLVPTKALAEAKYRQFLATYGPLGLNIAISTQDRKGADLRIARGEYDLAVTVPEKLWAMVLLRPALCQAVGALVVDELQLVGDPERGPCLELLISRLLGAGRTQIVGLSAVLSNGAELARWLRAALVEETVRPVELRKGVLLGRSYLYVEHNTGRSDREDLVGDAETGQCSLQALVAVACELAQRGEPTLTFLRDRRSAVQAARLAAERLSCTGSNRALEAMRQLPRTQATALLTETLAAGVAFHTADLHFSERQVVEAAFARQEAHCLFATSTLAVGLNLPARNVIVDPLRWRAAPRSAPALEPLSQSDFENMAGRAGRLGFGDPFGRAILLGSADFDADALMRRYVHAPPEPVLGQLGKLPSVQRFLLAAAMDSEPAQQPAAGPTLSDLQQPGAPSAELDSEALRLAQSAGLLVPAPLEAGRYIPTGLGRAAAASGLSLGTAAAIVAGLRSRSGVLTNLEALILACLSPEARAVPLPAGRNDRLWLWHLEEHARHDAGWTDTARELLWAGALSTAEREQAARVALVVLQWSANRSAEDLEEHTGVPSGRALALCDAVGWLLQCIARFASEMAAPPGDVSRLELFAEATSAALPEDCLPIHRLHIPSLQRDHVLSLCGAGFATPVELLNASDDRLRGLVPETALHEIRALTGVALPDNAESREAVAPDEPAAPAPLLVVDPGRPDIALVHGQEVPLTDTEFRLLSLLAASPGRCVSFDHVYDELWGIEHAVEPQQIYWHRHHLSKKLRRVMPKDASDPIKTIARRGLMLNLRPEQVVAA